jgi:hypothetical protein
MELIINDSLCNAGEFRFCPKTGANVHHAILKKLQVTPHNTISDRIATKL